MTIKRLTFICMVVALAGAGLYYSLARNIHTVLPGKVYRSAQLQPEVLKPFVQQHGIRTIINLRGNNAGNSWYEQELTAAADLGVHHFDVKLDATSLPRVDQLRRLLDLLGKSPGPFLLHCKRGADRTGLASAVALILEGNKDLSDIEDQLSWRYQIAASDTSGKLLLDAYQKWLQSKGWTHSKEIFLKWLREDYEDDAGNLYYFVDGINEQSWNRPNGLYREGHVFAIDRARNKEINIVGWAIDVNAENVLAGLEIYLGGVALKNVNYGTARPDVGNDLGSSKYTNSGWIAREDIAQFVNGCHDLVFRMKRLNGSNWLSPPQGRICIQ